MGPDKWNVAYSQFKDSSSPVIAVMQTAHALLANHRNLFQSACPASRRLLVQPEVGSVVVIIGNVLAVHSTRIFAWNNQHVKASFRSFWNFNYAAALYSSR